MIKIPILTKVSEDDHFLSFAKCLAKQLELTGQLFGQLAPLTLIRLEQHMAAINSYYSNLIEGNSTRPHEIRAAQTGNYSGDPAKRDLQQESLAHMQVQEWLIEQKPISKCRYTTPRRL